MKINIEINIEEIILQGFGTTDQYKIGLAVEQELERLINEKGLFENLSEDRNVYRLNAGTFCINESTKPELIGIQTANSIYGGLKL